MSSFYIVPPRKTQLSETGISISGVNGVKTTLPYGAAITSIGGLQLDTAYSPTWTGVHTFSQPIIFSSTQTIGSQLLSVANQALGDLLYYNGTSWTRLPIGSNNQVLTSFNSSIGWSSGIVANYITASQRLTLTGLSGVLKATAGVVSGNSVLNDISGVSISLPASGNYLKYNGTTWVNAPIPLPDRSVIIRFLNGYTPTATGIDIEIALVPYEPSDGTTVLEYTISRVIFQVETAGSTSSTVVIERALAGQPFGSPVDPGDVIATLTLTAGQYEVFTTTGFPHIYSGERLRLNISSIGSGSAGWTVQVEGTSGNPASGINAGITSINSLTASLQTIALGSSGTDVNIVSSIDTHTINIPSASGTNRGLVATGSQTFAGIKTFSNTTDSTSTSTGSLIVAGGVAIGKSAYVSGNLYIQNNLILNNQLPIPYGGTGLTSLGLSNDILGVNNSASGLEYKTITAGTGITIAHSTNTIEIIATGGGGGGTGTVNAGLGGSFAYYATSGTTVSGTANLLYSDSVISILSNTNSTSSTTGALTIVGGLGVSGNVNIGSGLGVSGQINAGSGLSVAGLIRAGSGLSVQGGAFISGSLRVHSGANINSNNISSTTTSSGFVFSANSLTTGTGAYIASDSLTTGRLVDISVSGNTAIGARTGVYVTVQGTNVNTGVLTYGIFTNNVSTNSGTNIGLGAFASGGTNNIPLRLGLSTNRYINFFINSEGNGLTLSPTGNGNPFLALGGYSGVTAELRLLQSGGFGSVKYVALKAPNTVSNTYELIFPDTYPASSNMTLVGTGTTQVVLSWSSISSGGIGGTINAGDQYKLAYYVDPNGSTVLDGAQALTYSTSNVNLTISATAATVVPLKLIGAVSQTANLFQVATSSANILTIDKDGITNFTNNVSITSATGSTSPLTGALTVSGGLGVSGNINAGSGLSVSGLISTGTGLSVEGTAYISGSLTLGSALATTSGGTGLSSIGASNQVLGINNGATGLEYKTVAAGSGISINHTANQIEIVALSGGSGTVNTGIGGSVAYYASNGTAVSGTPNLYYSDTYIGILSNSNSTSSTTGALRVVGGVGISGSLNVGSGLSVSGLIGSGTGLSVEGGAFITGGLRTGSGLSVAGISTLSGQIIAGSGISATGLIRTGTGLSVEGNASISGVLTLGTPLGTIYGGTGLSSVGSSNRVLGVNSGATGLEYKNISAGSGIQINHTANQIEIVALYSGSGFVNSGVGGSVAYYASNGTAVTGTPKLFYSDTYIGILSNSNSTSSTSGALRVVGGLGVSGNITAGSGLSVSGLISAGSGVSIEGALYVAGTIRTGSGISVAGISTLTGQVNVGSGISVAGLIRTGTGLSVEGTAYISGALTLGTALATSSGGTGLNSIGTSNQVLGVNNGATGLEYKTIAAGSGIQVNHTSNQIEIVALSGGSGTVNSGIGGSVAYYAANGTAVSGTPNLYYSDTYIGILSNSNSTSSTTGALRVVGGLGVSGNITAGSGLSVSGLISAGSGVSVEGSIYVAGTIRTGSGISVAGISTLTGQVNAGSGLSVAGLIRTGTGLSVEGSTYISNTLRVGSGISVAGISTFTGQINAGSGISVAGLIRTGTGLSVEGTAYISGALTLGTALATTSGGTGLNSIGSGNQVLGVNNGATGLEYKTIAAGSGIQVNHTTNQIEIVALSGGSGTVNTGTGGSVAYYASNGTAVSGTPNLSYSDTVIKILSNTNSTTSTSGALQVVGGLGVSGNVNIGSGLGVSGTLRFTSGVFGSTASSDYALQFLSSANNPITLKVTSDNSIVFDGSSGRLFAISDNLSSGIIYSVNNISGLPLFRIDANGTVSSNEFGANFGIGTSSPGYKLTVSGGLGVTGVAYFLDNTNSTSSTSGSVIIVGGLGVSGDINGGTGLSITGTARIGSGLSVQSTSTLVGAVSILSNTNSTSSTTGALRIVGGLGVSGDINGGTGLSISGTARIGSGLSVQSTSTLVGSVSILSNTNSTSSTTGALTIVGGLGVSGDINGGTGLSITGTARIGSGLSVQSTSTLVGSVSILSNTNSTSSTTGALTIVGGLGVSGDINGGTGLSITGTARIGSGLSVQSTSTLVGSVSILSNTNSTSSTTGALTIVGGLGVSGDINGGTGLSISGTARIGSGLSVQSTSTLVGAVSILSNTNSTSSTTGALRVTGGVGISGNINIGIGLSVAGNANIFGSLTLGTALATTSGGTGLNSIGSGNQVLGANSGSTGLEYKTISGGSGIQVNHTANQIEIVALSGGSGTVNSGLGGSVAYYAANGTAVSGTPNLLYSDTYIGILSNSNSTSSTSGALRVLGGLGVSGNVNVGSGLSVLGNAIILSNTNSTSSTTGALIVIGGLGVSGNLNVGSGVSIQGSAIILSNVNSTSSTSGALRVIGGLGVSGNINIGTGLSVAANTNIYGTLTLSNALSTTSGGTGLNTIGSGNQVLGVNSGASGLEYKTISAGSGIQVNHTANQIEIVALSGGSGTVNSGIGGSIAYYPTNGTAVSGTPNLSYSDTVIKILSNTNSTSSTTGAMQVVGGLGVSGNVNIGTGLSVQSTSTLVGQVSVLSNTNSTSSTSGALLVVGGLGVSGNINIGTGLSVQSTSTLVGQVSILSNTNSTSSTTGALLVVGGLGVSGNLNIGTGLSVQSTSTLVGSVSILSNSNSTSSTSGALRIVGGLGVSGDINGGTGLSISGTAFIGTGLSVQSTSTLVGAVSILSNTNSTSSTSGALIILGGLGVSGNVNIGTGLSVTSSVNIGSGLSVQSTSTLIGAVSILSNTNSTSSTTGALRVLGGLGVSGDINGGTGLSISGTARIGSGLSVQSASTLVGAVSILSNTNSTSSTSGALTVVGGLGVSGNINIGTGLSVQSTTTLVGQVSVLSNTNSTSSTSGALQVVGGLGVSGNINVGTGLSVNGNTLISGFLNVGTGLSVAGSATFKNGSASAGGAPIYLNSGTNLTSPEAGAVEFDGTYLYFTPSSVRKQISNIAISGTAPTGASAGDFWWDSENGVLKIYYDSYWIEASGTDAYTAVSNQILSITDTTQSTSSTTGALKITGGIGVSGNLNIGSGLGVSGLTTLTYTSEILNTKTSATGTVAHDLTTGSIFYHSSISNNFTANITNVPVTNDRAIGVTLVLSQGGTAYMATALQIDGSAQTIKWVNNVTPSGAANKVDIVGFSLIRTGSAWTVLGQYSTYG